MSAAAAPDDGTAFYQSCYRAARANLYAAPDPADEADQELRRLIDRAVTSKLDDMDNGCHDVVSGVGDTRPRGTW